MTIDELAKRVTRYKLVHDSEYQSQMLARADGGWIKYSDLPALILAAEARGMERSAEIMDRRHAEFMEGKGRNHADYTSAYNMSAAAIRAAAREIKP